jgi:hypothetical protein
MSGPTKTSSGSSGPVDIGRRITSSSELETTTFYFRSTGSSVGDGTEENPWGLDLSEALNRIPLQPQDHQGTWWFDCKEEATFELPACLYGYSHLVFEGLQSFVDRGILVDTITAFSDYGGTVINAVLVSAAGHSLTTGATLLIEDPDFAYSGLYEITTVDPDSFYFVTQYGFSYDPGSGSFRTVPTYTISQRTITAFSDYSGTVAGTILATSVAHELQTNDKAKISGTTNYNNLYVITKVDDDSFYFTEVWVADESPATFPWIRDTAGQGLIVDVDIVPDGNTTLCFPTGNMGVYWQGLTSGVRKLSVQATPAVGDTVTRLYMADQGGSDTFYNDLKFARYSTLTTFIPKGATLGDGKDFWFRDARDLEFRKIKFFIDALDERTVFCSSESLYNDGIEIEDSMLFNLNVEIGNVEIDDCIVLGGGNGEGGVLEIRGGYWGGNFDSAGATGSIKVTETYVAQGANLNSNLFGTENRLEVIGYFFNSLNISLKDSSALTINALVSLGGGGSSSITLGRGALLFNEQVSPAGIPLVIFENGSGGTTNGDITGSAIIDYGDGTYVEGSPCSWTQVNSFDNSWGSSGAGKEPSFTKSRMGEVKLRGAVTGGTVDLSAFTLGAGYRPVTTLTLAVVTDTGIGRLVINTDGTVVPNTSGLAVEFYLDGIVFTVY